MCKRVIRLSGRPREVLFSTVLIIAAAAASCRAPSAVVHSASPSPTVPQPAGNDGARSCADLQDAVKQAILQGRKEGRELAAEEFAAEKAADELASRRQAEQALAGLQQTLQCALLLGERRLDESKAKAMTGGQLLELATVRMEEAGLRSRLALSLAAIADVQHYSESKVLLALSPEFSSEFVANFQRMSLHDALGLLGKVFGFSVWLGHDGRTVWLGYPVAPPPAVPHSAVEMRFDEKKYTSPGAGL